MISRRRIGAKKPKTFVASNSIGLHFSKGVTREDEKVLKRLAQNERVSEVRRHVWARSGGYCELCRETETDAFRRGVPGKLGHEMHECYSRAHTKKMRPEHRFDPAWCIRVCPSRCHRRLTENRIEVVFFDVTRGAEFGPSGMAVVKKGQIPDGWFTAEEVWRYLTTREGT